jgi:hypothetical protein
MSLGRSEINEAKEMSRSAMHYTKGMKKVDNGTLGAKFSDAVSEKAIREQKTHL